MALISLHGVRKAFGAFQALDEVTFTVGASEKVALVGPNGSGKTTILRLVAGLDTADSGSVSVLPGCTIGFMPQDSELSGEGSLLDEVANASSEVRALEQTLRDLEAAISKAGEEERDALIARYGEAQVEFERLGGYAFEAEVKAALSGLGLGPEHWEKCVRVLSGGQKTRAALAKLLLQKPDILLLDEPTNHLDIGACEWLEDFLQSFSRSVLIVSHDRYFLDKVVSKVVDLHGRCTRSYPGNYSAFVKQKQDYLTQQGAAYEAQQEEMQKLESFILRYKAGQRAKQARGREKKLAKMAPVARPRDNGGKMGLNLQPAAASGRMVADLQGVGKSFGDKRLFSGLDILVESGDRVGLVGPNGSGKTTLIKMILGSEPASAGVITLGHNVEVGYFAQDLGGLDPESSVIDELLDAGELNPGEARGILAQFLFRGDDVFKSVSALSGGERNRLALAKLMVAKPNLLILDEPTNHLDIDSRDALGDALGRFDGAIILTSHDRYLLNSVATRIVEISGGAARVFAGNYDMFAEHARPMKAPPPKKKPKPQPKSTPPRRKGPTPAELERAIEAAEARLAELTEALGNPDTFADHELAALVLSEHQELTAQVECLYHDWAELAG